LISTAKIGRDPRGKFREPAECPASVPGSFYYCGVVVNRNCKHALFEKWAAIHKKSAARKPRRPVCSARWFAALDL
jgi:hypothetical protein